MIRIVWFVDFIFCFVGFNGRAWYEFDNFYNIETLCRFISIIWNNLMYTQNLFSPFKVLAHFTKKNDTMVLCLLSLPHELIHLPFLLLLFTFLWLSTFAAPLINLLSFPYANSFCASCIFKNEMLGGMDLPLPSKLPQAVFCFQIFTYNDVSKGFAVVYIVYYRRLHLQAARFIF